MKIEKHRSRWGDALHLGPYIDWQDWDVWHHCFTIGFSFGPWDIGLKVILWDIEETIAVLKDHGMTDEEAWDFCRGIFEGLAAAKEGKVVPWREVKKQLDLQVKK